MKIINVLSLVLLTTFFIKPDVALAGGFEKTCSNLKLDRDKTHLYLSATCVKRNGQKANSKLDLNKYIANHNGVLSWSPGEGGLIKSCGRIGFYIDLKGDSSLTGDYCIGNPQPFSSMFALNDHISNRNGVLVPDL
ncbi:MAG: CVNH domain-containing protein [Nostoc sp.]|uniref:CVNH domain-containing protein n=1 Tax=Nostoc sp. TaxID=1180 RepID=UPI002FFB3CDC